MYEAAIYRHWLNLQQYKRYFFCFRSEIKISKVASELMYLNNYWDVDALCAARPFANMEDGAGMESANHVECITDDDIDLSS